MEQPIQKVYTNPYETLGLAQGATQAEIKKAYFALVRTHPPEREPVVFKRIRAAYERLRDPDQRAETDMQLLRPWPDELGRKRRPPKLDTSLHPEDVLVAAQANSDLEQTNWRKHYKKVHL